MTNVEATCRVYEQASVRRVTGDAIRPGGRALTRHALALAALPSGARVLDVGCGVGATVALCRDEFGLDAVGLDLSARLLAEGCDRRLLQATALHAPFAAGAFAAVLAECSLSLVTDWNRALAEIRRMLRPGGWLIISDIYASPKDRGAAAPSRLRCCLSGARSHREIKAHLAAHSFELLHWEDHTTELKQFAARLIWEHGSLADFWACTGATEREIAAFPAQPGYFLLMAHCTGEAICT